MSLNLILTQQAEADLDAIGDYTLEKWGIEQAIQYTLELLAGCRLLADFPEAGREAKAIPGYRRFECHTHVIFYRLTESDLRVVRILHQNRIPSMALIGEE